MSPSKGADEVKAGWVPNVPSDAKELGTPPEDESSNEETESSESSESSEEVQLPEMTDGAKALIEENQLSNESILEIEPTGKDGKLIKADIEKYLAPEDETKVEKVFPALRFEQSGWCEKLGRSYRKGHYRPRTEAEYKALKPFAKASK